MSGPHTGGQTMATDVTQREEYAAARLLYGEKVAGQVANGENFAGNLEVVTPNQTRGAQAPVRLRSFKECGVQIGVILLKRRELLVQFQLERGMTRVLSRRGRDLDVDRKSCRQPAIKS